MSITPSSTLNRTAIPARRGSSYLFSSGSSNTMTQQVTLPEASERAYVSRLWAEDWDSAEDAIYDSM